MSKPSDPILELDAEWARATRSSVPAADPKAPATAPIPAPSAPKTPPVPTRKPEVPPTQSERQVVAAT